MSEVRVNNLTNENNTGGPTISGITTYSGRHFFVPPVGDTTERPSDCEPGSLRFNTDTLHLEYFRGDTIGWTEIEAELASDILGGGSGSNEGIGVRGIYFGGTGAPSTDRIDFFTISTLGNAEDFGDAAVSAANRGGVASRTRGVVIAGQPGASPYYMNSIEFITISSTGNGTDFGDSTQLAGSEADAASNQIRGVRGCGGGQSGGFINVLEYITIAQTGNALDFGDLVHPKANTCQSTMNTVRGLFAGGYTGPSNPTNNAHNIIEFITIMTTGNTTDFGDLTQKTRRAGAVCNSTRSVFANGLTPSNTNVISFVTTASTGNAIDFGDTLTQNNIKSHGSSSPTRGVFCGGYVPGSPGVTNAMEFIEIATTGNGKDFGDLVAADGAGAAISNGHGGL